MNVYVEKVLRQLIPLKYLRLLVGVYRNAFGKYRGGYHRWIKKYDCLTQLDRDQMLKSIALFTERPLISIVMPVYRPHPNFFTDAIESVRKQIYQNWELILIEDAGHDQIAKPIMKQFALQDDRIKTESKVKVVKVKYKWRK